MATDVRTFNSGTQDDAAFRVWGSAANAALAAVGLVQAADTGQINWTTVTFPGVNATAAGYEIWRFNDALQATAPVFIKIEYGRGGGATVPKIWVTVGQGTDGAGVVTGYKSGRIDLNSPSNTIANATNYNHLTSGANNRVACAIFANFNGGSQFFFVERTKDAAGADTAEGVMYLLATGGSTTNREIAVLPYSGLQPAVLTQGAPSMMSGGGATTAIRGADVGVYPFWFFLGRMLPPPKMLISYWETDIAKDSTFAVTRYGASRTYRALGSIAQGMSVSSTGNRRAAILWE